MGMATSGYCYRLIGNYIDEIDSLEKKMTKNLSQMDLLNASVQGEMEELVNSMTSKCESLKSTLGSYSFE